MKQHVTAVTPQGAHFGMDQGVSQARGRTSRKRGAEVTLLLANHTFACFHRQLIPAHHQVDVDKQPNFHGEQGIFA